MCVMRQLVDGLETVAAMEVFAHISADVGLDRKAATRVLIHPPRDVEDILVENDELLALLYAGAEFID